MAQPIGKRGRPKEKLIVKIPSGWTRQDMVEMISDVRSIK